MSAEPKTIKGTVCPMRRDIRERDIEELLNEMEEQQLVKVYSAKATSEDEVDGLALQVLAWWEYQALREPKPSRYHPPDGWDKDKVATPRSRDPDSGRFS